MRIKVGIAIYQWDTSQFTNPVCGQPHNSRCSKHVPSAYFFIKGHLNKAIPYSQGTVI